MPQMSPMSWPLIFIFLVMFLMITLSSMNTLTLSFKNKSFMKNKENTMKW